MSFSTDAGRLLGPGRSADILVYIHRRGGCMLSSVYRDVTRNAHTRDRIDEMEERGLLIVSTMGRGTMLSLTPKGERVAEMLESVEEELAGGDSRQDSLDSSPGLRTDRRLH